MRKRLLPLCLAAAFAVSSLAGPAMSADHLDSPSVMADPAGDINDVFSWVDDNGDVILIMTVFPGASAASQFSPSLQYVFHTSSAAGYGMDETSTDIICTFDAAQTASCWVGAADFVTGDASGEAGVMSDSGDVQVFAGLRDDPFFFNLVGFLETISIVKGAAASLTFDDANCPAVDAGTSGVLVNQLASTAEGNPARDFFAPLNTLAITVKVDAGLVNAGGNTMAVWGATRMASAP